MCLYATFLDYLFRIQVNHVDLSPTYAGTLMGITNTFANVCGFLAPYVAGAVTNGNVR